MPRPWKLHKFWSCPRARKAWEWTITLSCIVSMCCRTPSLCVEKCLFNGKLDTSLRKFGAYGPHSGVSFYLDREVFFSSSWHDAKLGKIMWDGLLDYGKLEWMQNSLLKVKQQLDKEAKLLKEFDRVCSLNGSLCLCGSWVYPRVFLLCVLQCSSLQWLCQFVPNKIK